MTRGFHEVITNPLIRRIQRLGMASRSVEAQQLQVVEVEVQTSADATVVLSLTAAHDPDVSMVMNGGSRHNLAQDVVSKLCTEKRLNKAHTRHVRAQVAASITWLRQAELDNARARTALLCRQYGVGTPQARPQDWSNSEVMRALEQLQAQEYQSTDIAIELQRCRAAFATAQRLWEGQQHNQVSERSDIPNGSDFLLRHV